MTRIPVVLALAALQPVFLGADTIYSITNLGVLSGGTYTSGSAVSSNGLAAGSGDTDTALSQPFQWASGPGLAGVSPVGSILAFGRGINASGVVVGYEFSADLSVFRAFINDGSGAVGIPTLGGANNAATAINNSGTVVGNSDNQIGPQTAFVYSGGSATSLGTLPGGATSQANAINASGHTVGSSDVTPGGALHAFVWNGGVWTDLGVLNGFQWSEATAISDADHVAGTLYDDVGASVAFLWTAPTSMTLLGALTPGGNSSAFGVNANGVVVGTSDGVAFLYQNSQMYDLSSLLDSSSIGWTLQQAVAINDLGRIVGTGLYNGEQRAFILTPTSSAPEVPEPAAGALVGVGTLLLAVRKLRHSRREN